MYGAKKLDEHNYKKIYQMVDDLAEQMHIPRPQLWLITSNMANAFATGRSPKHASVAITTEILNILEPHELRGVLAHELAHVKNRDILVATIAATIAGAIGYLASMLRWTMFFGNRERRGNDGTIGALLAVIFMPIAAMLIQLAISRSREYLADESGSEYSEDPLALASALEKLHSNIATHHFEPKSYTEASTASLFIMYPFVGKGLLALFSTHPPVEKRIAKLRQMAGII